MSTIYSGNTYNEICCQRGNVRLVLWNIPSEDGTRIVREVQVENFSNIGGELLWQQEGLDVISADRLMSEKIAELEKASFECHPFVQLERNL